MLNLHPPTAGTLAQLVEQRTENPCVPGSIPGGTTQKNQYKRTGFFIAFSRNRPLRGIFLIVKWLNTSTSSVRVVKPSAGSGLESPNSTHTVAVVLTH